MKPPLKKSGFVALVGRSNVGKSTLLNAIIKTKVAIVTPKAQTTRLPMRGILHDPRGQIVFVDTPGLFLGKKDALSQKLNTIVREQLTGIDGIVYVVDPTREPGEEEEGIQEILKRTEVPIILVINKIDVTSLRRPYTDHFRKLQIGQKATIEISALQETDLAHLVDTLFDLMPIGEPFYPEHQLTDTRQADWLSEFIREKIFLRMEEEVPYTIHVEVTSNEVRQNNDRFIAATIWTTDERYKGMIIGARGQMLKRIGMDVRQELELVMDTHVYLELHVAVDPKWPERFTHAPSL